VVRTFDAAEFELSRFDAQALQLRRLLLKTMATSSLITPMTQVVAAIGVSIIITLAIYQASQGSTTVGEFVSFITALLMTISPMRHLTDIYQPITGALITVRGAFDLINAPPEPDDGTLDMPHCRGDIRFQQVQVHYESAAAPSLNCFDLQSPAGQTDAFVGAAGAGKTTVVNTLLRFPQPTRGQILLDDIAREDQTLTS